MRTIEISIEKNGAMVRAGSITGNGPEDATFAYDPAYLEMDDAIPLCIAMPLQGQSFSAKETRRYFDGLLPEGFTRRSVAGAIHADEDDYLSILTALGSECIGAIMALEDDGTPPNPHYKKLNDTDLLAIANEGATESAQIVVESHVSLAGASGKVGLYRVPKSNAWLLPSGTAPSTHIVKQGHVRFDSMVLNEQLCLSAAERCGINVASTFVIPTVEPLFATERFDRVIGSSTKFIDGYPAPARLHQQDFGQALGIAASAKYERPGERYLERCFDIVRRYSTNPREDVVALWDGIMFSLVIGNLDNHVKNYALMYSSDWRSLRLTPLYDIVSTLIYPNTSKTLPLSLGGVQEVQSVTRGSIVQAAHDAGLGKSIALERLDRIIELIPNALTDAANTLAEAGFTVALDIAKRIMAEWNPRRKQLC